MNREEIFQAWAAKKNNGILRYRTKLYDQDLINQDKIIESDGKFLSEKIIEHEVPWSEVSNIEIFTSLLDKMDEGILVIINIPKIPDHFEHYSKAYYGFDTEDNGYGFIITINSPLTM